MLWINIIYTVKDLSQRVPIITSLESPREPPPPRWTPRLRRSFPSSHLGCNLSFILWPESEHNGWFYGTMLTSAMSYSQHARDATIPPAAYLINKYITTDLLPIWKVF